MAEGEWEWGGAAANPAAPEENSQGPATPSPSRRWRAGTKFTSENWNGSAVIGTEVLSINCAFNSAPLSGAFSPYRGSAPLCYGSTTLICEAAFPLDWATALRGNAKAPGEPPESSGAFLCRRSINTAPTISGSSTVAARLADAAGLQLRASGSSID